MRLISHKYKTSGVKVFVDLGSLLFIINIFCSLG